MLPAKNRRPFAKRFGNVDTAPFPVTLCRVLAGILNGTFKGMRCSSSTATANSQRKTARSMNRGGLWDLLIAHPPCTFLSNAGAVRLYPQAGKLDLDRYAEGMKAKEFFMKFYNAECEKIAIENPTPLKIVELPPYSQAIQPYFFGSPYSKRTCLWLKGLTPLKPTNLIEDHKPWVNGGCKDATGNYRRFTGRNERDPKTRSKTFIEIAEAMAEQWG